MNQREQTATLQEATPQEATPQEAELEMQRVRWALAQPDVTPADKLVLAAMALDARHGSGVTLRDCRQIADDIHWNPGQTEDSIRHLEAAGLIQIPDTGPVGNHALQRQYQEEYQKENQEENQEEFAAVVTGARMGWDPGTEGSAGA